MLRVGAKESLTKIVTAVHLRVFSAEAAQLATSADAPPNVSEDATGGIRTLGGLPLPRFVLTQHRDRSAPAPLMDAIRAVQSSKRARFDESVDLAVNLGIDSRRGDQMVRGAVTLPHGTGKAVRVCVFAKGEAAEAARAAGADIVGDEDLISRIQESGGSGLAFDKCVATPELMAKLGKIARILGPRGLMPNPKLGTVTPNVAEAIGQLKRGRVEFRADKGGVVHATVGRMSFGEAQVAENVGALAGALLAARPKGVKGSGAGGYLLGATLSSTMGSGMPVTIASLVHAAQGVKTGKSAA